MNGTNKSYDLTLSHLKIKKIVSTTKSSLVQKRNNMDREYFKRLNTLFGEFIYGNNKQRRLIAVDGSCVNLVDRLKHDGVKEGGNKKYRKALLSSLFDVDKRLPINYELFTNFDERLALEEQLKYVTKGDILIMDRGYYSDKLMHKLTKLGIKFIFRLPVSMDKKIDDIIITKKINDEQVNLRIVKFIVEKKMKKKK